jgi:predicted NUDIX family NTP pyrophosphohydrolase
MAIRSAGLVVHRTGPDGRQVLIAHLGGPYWSAKDDGAWTFPKGEVEPGEDERAAARREFAEELGLPVPDGRWDPLGEFRQSGGKTTLLWAVAGDLDPADVRPGTFELEWPPRSGRIQRFPELDRVGWFCLDQAEPKLTRGLRPVLGRLAELLGEA